MRDFKEDCRKMTNAALRLCPAPLMRYFLKSVYFQPKLQDDLRFHVKPYRFDNPLPDVHEIDVQQLRSKRALAGFPSDLAAFLPLLEQLKPFSRELAQIPRDRAPGIDFWFHNNGYEDFDAVSLYTLIRYLKPKSIIEVGSGFSSRVITLASAKNATESAKPECLFIEPYPPKHLLEFKLGGQLLVEKLQNVPHSRFSTLSPGDILFIDSTHVMRTQSDLSYIFHHILPLLPKGVFIHFHDVFSPYDYPEEWVMDVKRGWNEQYVLESVLCNSKDFEIILPLHGLFRDYQSKLKELLPTASKAPGAFWIKKV